MGYPDPTLELPTEVNFNSYLIPAYLKEDRTIFIRVTTEEEPENRRIYLKSIDAGDRSRFADLLLDIEEYFSRHSEKSYWKEFEGLFNTRLQ